MTVTALPQPGRHRVRAVRWQPRRAGILNVWRYYDEVFEFHAGRLLLRGPNGSGKSKALELLLPFLFDASLRPNRLSTFGTSERTMHWNMMGDGARGTTRVGYVWLEFSAGDGTADDRWFTCGARLQASAHTTSAQADYFTLAGPVPPTGFTTATGEPLGRAALAELLGDRGRVHAGAGDYRAAVRERLFAGLSEQRYEALILALLQLRTPKLSQRLDPALLSTLLSRALPALGETEIGELAEGFERLDRQREELARLDDEVTAAGRLCTRQETYARRVLRDAAAALITATSDLDGVTRTVRTSQQRLDEGRTRRQEVAGALETAQREVETVRTDIDSLRESREYREGADRVQQLDRLRIQAHGAATRAGTSRAAATSAASTAEGDAAAAGAATLAAQKLAGRAAELEAECAAAAGRASLAATHAELGPLARSDRSRALTLLDAAVTGRLDQIGQVRTALGRHVSAVERRDLVEEQLESARAELAEATAERDARSAELSTERRHRADRLSEWARGCREIRLADTGAGTEAVAELADDEPALAELVDRAAATARDELAGARAAATQRRGELAGHRSDLVEERARVEAQRYRPPAAPLTRTTDRSAQPGAPLWQLVDFTDAVATDDRAGVEAALEASGVLDAWVLPDGSLSIDGHDVLADPHQLGSAPGGSLDDVLHPEPDGPVPAGRLRTLLRAVAFGDALPAEHPAAVGADGRWRLGALSGSWAKPEPEYIGATARERARQRRLAELDASIDDADASLRAVDVELAELTRRADRLDAELAARPDRAALNAAHEAFDRAEHRLGAADRDVQRWVTKRGEATAAVRERARELAALAAESGLPTGGAELDELQHAVEAFRRGATLWLNASAELAAARDKADAALAVAERSAAQAHELGGRADADEGELRILRRSVQTTEESIDAGYHEIIARLDQLRGALTAAQRSAGQQDEALRAVELEIARLEERVRGEEERRASAVEVRDAAGARMRGLCASVLPLDAGIELDRTGEDGVKATLEAARAVASRWPAIPHLRRNIDEAFARLTEELHAGRDTLGTRADLVLEPEGDVQILTALVGGVRLGAAALRDRVAEEAGRARDDISAAEHELFDTTLTGNTRRHLADRIRQANDLVDRMNERLAAVRTASKVAVQLVWQVDPDLSAAARTARDLLLRNPASLSDDDRAALHRFLRDRVEQARAEGGATSWEEQLAEVFDYTRWHRFVVRVDRGDGDGWQLLTKRLHGALSGGEKAIALHLPLFAAVAAHYQAVPDAPRIILLDEVFVGVDTTNRGQVFALLASLDLDLVLTSDHEWCAYAELDGIAVHALTTGDDGDDAVTTTRFVWDGADWLDDPEPDSPTGP
jgi:uncharacterized protein (TIGR02680 family)